MNTFRNLVPAVLLSLLLGASCSGSKSAQSSEGGPVVELVATAQDPNRVAVGSNNSMSLVDYLRRVPGLQINEGGGSVNVMIRGANSFSGDNNPLFVIDNQAVGTNYNDVVSAVDVNDIRMVNVIKGAEGQQLFGMRGSNGVIQIITKKK